LYSLYWIDAIVRKSEVYVFCRFLVNDDFLISFIAA
jgi:hypothetical protein